MTASVIDCEPQPVAEDLLRKWQGGGGLERDVRFAVWHATKWSFSYGKGDMLISWG